MSIENITIGQIEAIKKMLDLSSKTTEEKPHPFVGKYCIVRCYSAGVHAGYVKYASGTEVLLTNSRRLWQWSAKAGIALSGVAQNGYRGSKVDAENPEIYLTEAIEIIPCGAGVKESIDAAFK